MKAKKRTSKKGTQAIVVSRAKTPGMSPKQVDMLTQMMKAKRVAKPALLAAGAGISTHDFWLQWKRGAHPKATDPDDRYMYLELSKARSQLIATAYEEATQGKPAFWAVIKETEHEYSLKFKEEFEQFAHDMLWTMQQCWGKMTYEEALSQYLQTHSGAMVNRLPSGDDDDD